MKYVKLSLTGKRGEGKYARVDEKDAERASAHSWHVDDFGYPRTRIKGESVRLHRFVLCPTWGEVDHKNGDPLDNRKKNLREVTHAQNCCNKRIQSNNKSGLKGVSFTRGHWQAVVRVNGKRRWLGYFLSKEDAAKAYDKAAKKLQGNFAKTNF